MVLTGVALAALKAHAAANAKSRSRIVKEMKGGNGREYF